MQKRKIYFTSYFLYMNPYFFRAKLLALALFALVGCGSLERDINLDLPQVPRELVVECYLEAGQPYRLLLTETKGFFDDLDECPLVRGATVIIKHNGQADTLREAVFLGECTLQNPNFIPFLNAERSRFFNYGSDKICPLSYDQDFELEVQDPLGNRRAIARTRMVPPLGLDTIRANFREDGRNEAFALIISQRDDPNTADFYRMVLVKGELFEDGPLGTRLVRQPEFVSLLADNNFFNGQPITWGTGYNYQAGDTLTATLFRIEADYFTYLRTLRDSERANGSPFAQPPVIRSNVQGGFGIFTFLSYDRKTVILTP